MRLIDADALIGALHNHTFLEGDDRSVCYNVIQKQPTIESEIMDDLISRQAAITGLIFSDDTGNLTCGQVAKILNVIKALPSADAVSVVRCGDCVCHSTCRHEQYLGLNGFCSYGERK